MDAREFHRLADELTKGASAAHCGQVIAQLEASLLGPSRAQIQMAIAKWRRENGYP
jgi:hypothetical protein